MSLLSLAAEPQAWASLLTLTALEIVLGIDNLVFVAVAISNLPHDKRKRAGRLGLGLAVVLRLGLLSGMFWLTRLTTPLLTLYGHEISLRDAILGLGGFFLLYKATEEIHGEIDPGEEEAPRVKTFSYTKAIIQIALLDIVFSFDSVLTALGMANELEIMILAMLIAVGIMIWSAAPLGRFIKEHPSVKMLALGFLLLIGMSLIADGFGQPIPKGFLYAAISFSLFVEGLNQWARRNRKKRERESS